MENFDGKETNVHIFLLITIQTMIEILSKEEKTLSLNIEMRL